MFGESRRSWDEDITALLLGAAPAAAAVALAAAAGAALLVASMRDGARLKADVFRPGENIARCRATHEDLEMLVRHELLHIFTHELSNLAEQWAGNEPVRQKVVEETNERATTMLERMPVWH